MPFPTAHPSARLGLPLDAPAHRARPSAMPTACCCVGGSFFEDVWYARAARSRRARKVAQIEASAGAARLRSSPRPGSGRLRSSRMRWATRRRDRPAGVRRATRRRTKRNAALVALKAKESWVPEDARAEKAWDARADLDAARDGRNPRRDAGRRHRRRRIDHRLHRSRPHHRLRRAPATTTAPRVAASARALPARSASRWPSRTGRWCASRATARRCMRSRRSGPRRTSTCRSCS